MRMRGENRPRSSSLHVMLVGWRESGLLRLGAARPGRDPHDSWGSGRPGWPSKPWPRLGTSTLRTNSQTTVPSCL